MTYNFEILRLLRKQHNFTIEELSDKSKISYAVISKLERNQTNPSLSTIQQLAVALKITATELVSMAEIKTHSIKTEECYEADGFNFRKIAYNNLKTLIVTGKKGKKISRPEIHEDNTEIVFVKEGEIKFSSNFGNYTLKKGQSIQFDAIFSHSYEAVEDCELIIIHIQKEHRF